MTDKRVFLTATINIGRLMLNFRPAFEILKLIVNINLQKIKRLSQKSIMALSPWFTAFCTHTTHHGAAMHPTLACNNPTHHNNKHQTHRAWPGTP